MQATDYFVCGLDIFLLKNVSPEHVGTTYSNLGEIRWKLLAEEQAKDYHARAPVIRLKKLASEHLMSQLLTITRAIYILGCVL